MKKMQKREIQHRGGMNSCLSDVIVSALRPGSRAIKHPNKTVYGAWSLYPGITALHLFRDRFATRFIRDYSRLYMETGSVTIDVIKSKKGTFISRCPWAPAGLKVERM
jgi:hypothetical protein